VHDDRELIEERITRELVERVLPLVHPERLPLAVEAGASLDELTPFEVGSEWGPPWGTTWFRCTADIPDSWSGARVEAIIDLGFEADSPGFQCEGLVRDADGQPVQGIHPRRMAVPVAATSGRASIVVEAASNPMFPQFQPSPLGSLETAGDKQLYRLRRADLVVVDPDGEGLLHDLHVLDGVMREFDVRDQRRPRLLRVLARALDAVAAGSSAAEVRAIVAPTLAVPTHRRISPPMKIGTGAVVAAMTWLDLQWSAVSLSVVLVVALAANALYGAYVWFAAPAPE